MATVFRFPDVGEGIHEGRVVEWLVRVGDQVRRDQALVKVETDKAVVELPSPEPGPIGRLHAETGQTIHVGDPLVTIGDAGEQPSGEPAPTDGRPEAKAIPPDRAAGHTPAPHRVLRAPATPHTRVLARRLGVDIEAVQGTGPGGRITDDDVQAAHSAAAAPAPQPVALPRLEPSPRPPSALEERVPMTHLRKVIAQAMQTSSQTAAAVTHVDEADVTELYAWYKELKPQVEQSGVRFTILPFFLKAATVALKTHPLLNASIDEERGEIVYKRFYHIGIAVDTPEGLIVPVIREADTKSVVAIAGEINDVAARARERKLNLDEIRGGTFTITNMGPLGGVFATPIIHQPEVAILGMHAIKDRPVVVDGEIVIRKMMYLSVTFDHRIIDGAEAGRFMNDMVALVSNPKLLMARI
ncbi:2-oxo acid dehydrogenase subunit E2 [Candidatus Fermentibacteria bacterium]|nr:2-oxo acid dehydrogenase subunit E2 [Candidatus Fermentibacteria bacterium]